VLFFFCSTDCLSSSTQQSQPLEYSPFNFTINTGWFPGDLAHASPISSGGMNSYSNSQTMGSPLGHIGSGIGQHPINSSAARAMNFASVAASGIPPSNLSTATAQLTHTGGVQNGGLVGSLGTGLSSSSLGGKGLCESSLEAELPKVILVLSKHCLIQKSETD